MAAAEKAPEGIERRKKGYVRPSLSAGLVDEGEIMGTREPDATLAAIADAPEHPAPMIASTPFPLNA
eukprot:5077962-Prymnesium_polylepis.1